MVAASSITASSPSAHSGAIPSRVRSPILSQTRRRVLLCHRVLTSVGAVQQRAGTAIEGLVPMDTRGWYVLVTSSSGMSVFATLGPFVTQEIAEQKARRSRVVHYRVEPAANPSRHVRQELAGSANS